MSKSQANGVLAISASQTQSNGPTNASSRKSSGPKLKVIIRRLAPGLTETEFTKIMGDEWKLGEGKVDWFQYKPGKNSTDPSKPSRPSRVYLHLTNESHLMELAETVRQLKFEDRLNTINSSCLLGPPSVEFAPYSRVPSGRRRTDTRQGTIDQDPEFMDFLESLANPVSTKDTVDESETTSQAKEDKVTITPLVQYIKDKKANKAKEAAANKANKQGKSSAKASKEGSGSTEEGKKSAKEAKKERLVEKATREAVKVLNRQAAEKTAAATANQVPEAPKNPRGQARERGSIAAAARILQRDLGLSPGNAHRKAKADAQLAAKAAAESQAAAITAPGTPTAPKGSHAKQKKEGKSSTPGGSTDEISKTPTTSKESPAAAPASPIVLLKKSNEPAGGTASPATPVATPSTSGKAAQASARKAQPNPVPSAGATRAFVKHANPSQGITEALLKEAMEAFGQVSSVEIDKRKGFAYVDFVEAEGLAKAMAANPTKIAQGTVQVLERKDVKPAREPPSGPAGRGGGSAGRGGRGGSSGRRGGRGASRGGGNSEAGAANTSTGSPATQAPPSAPTGPAADAAK